MRHQELLALGIFSSRSRLGDRIELLLLRGRTFSPQVSGVRVAATAVVLLGAVVACSIAPRLLAFQPQPAFDAASIKPNNTPFGGRAGPRGGSLRYAPGRVVGTVTARRIVIEAYHLTDYQLSGGPAWFDNDRFDIEGKAANPADEDQLRLMLQTLLADRFKLVVGHETKEMPVYALTVAKNGPTLQEWKPGEARPAPARRHKVEGTPVLTMAGQGTMQHLADTLSRNPSIDRPVLDKTGLQGTYLLFWQWGVDENVMTAVEDEFGLKFESQKAPMDTLVIDHIEKPDAN